ncbi:MAG: hypothetical protein AAB316_13410, partial [Bacteroidota bacterium]
LPMIMAAKMREAELMDQIMSLELRVKAAEAGRTSSMPFQSRKGSRCTRKCRRSRVVGVLAVVAVQDIAIMGMEHQGKLVVEY